MMSDNYSKYSAVDSTLGYLYQVGLALLLTLKKLRVEPDFLIGIETLDDVGFERIGDDHMELLQTKHHRTKTASLTDASPDLWKTLRIWFEGTISGDIPQTASMFLITTGLAPAGSAAFYLCNKGRDLHAAMQRLDATAQSSGTAVNAPAYAAYRAVMLAGF